MQIGNIAEFSYWFAVTTPAYQRSSFIVTFLLICILFALAIFLRVFASRQQTNRPLARALLRISRPLFFCAIMNFMLMWFRELGAAILSARVWIALVNIITVVWFAFVFRSISARYKEEFARIESERKYREYLPKRKK